MSGGGLREGGSFLEGFSWIWIGEFEFCSREGLVQGASVCWRFWARGPGYPYGILELGSCPSWQGGNTVWAELVVALSWARQQQEGQQDKWRVSIRPRYVNLRTYLFYSVMKLLFVDKFNMRMC
jgi:hypothetical protein